MLLPALHSKELTNQTSRKSSGGVYEYSRDGGNGVGKVDLTHVPALSILQCLQQVQKDQEATQLQGSGPIQQQRIGAGPQRHTGSCWKAGHHGTAQAQKQTLSPALVCGTVTAEQKQPWMSSLFVKLFTLRNLPQVVYLSGTKPHVK